MYFQKCTDIFACIYENSVNMLPFIQENHTDIIACIDENSVNMLSFIQGKSTDIFACIHENSTNMLPFVHENGTDNLTGIPESTTKPPATTRVIAGGNMFCGTIILKAFLRFNHKHYAYNLLNRSLIFLLSLSTCNATFA